MRSIWVAFGFKYTLLREKAAAQQIREIEVVYFNCMAALWAHLRVSCSTWLHLPSVLQRRLLSVLQVFRLRHNWHFAVLELDDVLDPHEPVAILLTRRHLAAA